MSALIYSCELYVSVLCLNYLTSGMTVMEFQPVQHNVTLDSTPLEEHQAISIIHCAQLCSANNGCKSFLSDYLAIDSGATKSTCLVLSVSVTATSDLSSGSLVFVQKKAFPLVISATTTTPSPITTTMAATTMAAITTTTTTMAATTSMATTTTTMAATTTTMAATTTTLAATTLPTTTLSPAITVIDIVYGPIDMAFTGSQKDFIVVTLDGVYVYDDVTSLTTGGPSRGPLGLPSVFPGYGAQLPSEADIGGTLLYQSDVEMYSSGDDYVYRWQIQSPTLHNQQGRALKTSHLGDSNINTLLNYNIQWCALRARNSVERHFYLGNDNFVMTSNQHGTNVFQKSDTVYDNNGFNMNPWSDIPTETIAASGYTDNPKENFVLIDSSSQVWTYQMDHTNGKDNNPDKIKTLIGPLKFAP